VDRTAVRTMSVNMKLTNRCVADLTRQPVEHVKIYMQDDDITTLHVALHYPETAPFMGGSKLGLSVGDFTLYATLHFHKDFPLQPPKLEFLSPWTNHQHLWGNRVCHSMLTDDFRGYFLGNGTHGTSMWNSACALADTEGVGGMPRYFQVLHEFLRTDLDYDEEHHVRYDQASLLRDATRQREFRPEWLATAYLLREESADPEPLTDAVSGEPSSFEELTDAYIAAVRGDATAEACDELHSRVMATRPAGRVGAGPALLRSVSQQTWGMDFFLKSPTKPGDADLHPCFDVTVKQVGRKTELSTTMTTLCQQSFDMGAKRTDFGTEIDVLLPYPCSRSSWNSVGSRLSTESLRKLMPHVAGSKLQMPSATGALGKGKGDRETAERMEAILCVVGELWVNTTIGIVKDEGFESERAMMCFITLHFWLLCLAEDQPGLRPHAVATVREFLTLNDGEPDRNLKKDVPSLGHFLVRFLLTESELPLKSAAQTMTRELFNRNVAWVNQRFWAKSGASKRDRDAQVQGTFESSQFGMKLTVFQRYYILRAAELSLDTVTKLEACCGRPAGETLRIFQADCRKIKEISSYPEFFKWMQLDALAEKDVHELLSAAVSESTARGYNGGKGGSKGGSKGKKGKYY